MSNTISNFVVIDSVYGKFIVNRYCDYQAETLIKTGATHIEPELKNILAVVNTLPDGALALDAGANIGLVSVPIAMALRAKHGSVLSFEVQRMLYYALCGSVALNDLENMHVFNQGLGSVRGSVEVPTPNYSKPADFGTLSLVNQPIVDTNGTLSAVPMIPIDDLALHRLDFLKIDVEGMELDVLKGARESIKKFRPYCWVEYWKCDRQELIQFFTSHNYTLYKMDPLNILCVPMEKQHGSGLTINAPHF
jgi:FkbM family methyltransferase